MWAEGREQQLSPSSLPPPLAHSLAHTGVARERASHPAVRRRREYAQFRYEWMKIWQLHTDRDVWNTISGSGWPVRCYVLLGPHLEQQRAVCLLLRNAISPKWSSACFFFFFFFHSRILSCRSPWIVCARVCVSVRVCLSQWLKGFHDLCPQDCEATRTGWKSFVWCWFALSASQLFRPLIRRPVTAVKICWSNNGKTFSAST